MGAPPARRVWLPLQTGESALRALVEGVILLFAGGVAFVVASEAGYVAAAIAFAALALLAAAALLRRAWIDRASDILVGREGVSIRRGTAGGTTWPWSDLDPERCELLGLEGKWTLVMGVRSGRKNLVRLAEARNDPERDSLAALLESIRSPRWRSDAGLAAAATPTSVLACPSCGALATPADAAHVACVACGATVPVPEDLRVRVKRSAELEREQGSAEYRIRSLLAQPGAARANAYLAGLALLGVLLVASARFVHPASHAMALAAVVLAAGMVVRTTVRRRQALRGVAVGLGARDPLRRGAPYQCRSCGGPLPGADDRIVVRCVYCDAVNVLGLDLRVPAQGAESEDLDVDRSFARATLRDRLAVGAWIAMVVAYAAFGDRVMSSPDPPSRAGGGATRSGPATSGARTDPLTGALELFGLQVPSARADVALVSADETIVVTRDGAVFVDKKPIVPAGDGGSLTETQRTELGRRLETNAEIAEAFLGTRPAQQLATIAADAGASFRRVVDVSRVARASGYGRVYVVVSTPSGLALRASTVVPAGPDGGSSRGEDGVVVEPDHGGFRVRVHGKDLLPGCTRTGRGVAVPEAGADGLGALRGCLEEVRAGDAAASVGGRATLVVPPTSHLGDVLGMEDAVRGTPAAPLFPDTSVVLAP